MKSADNNKLISQQILIGAMPITIKPNKTNPKKLKKLNKTSQSIQQAKEFGTEKTSSRYNHADQSRGFHFYDHNPRRKPTNDNL